ncbi:ABC transporter ATP-binding protein [Raineyella sp. LH-20]|uniref:ABC transporter ATP-binding protein n=1 Tax=Raineyella sp. LH-20 TaxID=3081204 RepID=UPI002952A62F|nr:ABC transporter ATP-binding protein [Raineyella sp. LH-20]WOP17430.1 ABC transporter ATP-binding protein [Raineyella sp. LH-20]
MIEVKDLTARYGQLAALRDVGLTLAPGEVVALLGANGAGKTTLLHSVAGLHRTLTGQILLDGREITGQEAAESTRQGISLVPAGRQVFAGLTVRQNLQLGMHGARLSHADKEHRIVDAIAMFPILGEFADRPAGLLSGGQQQMLAIARALVRKPAYLLLDEPSLGLAPQIVSQILHAVGLLTQDGMGILLAEQNATAALGVAARGVILENGVVMRTDAARVLLDDPEVSSHYLGTVEEEAAGRRRRVLPPDILTPILG